MLLFTVEWIIAIVYYVAFQDIKSRNYSRIPGGDSLMEQTGMLVGNFEFNS